MLRQDVDLGVGLGRPGLRLQDPDAAQREGRRPVEVRRHRLDDVQPGTLREIVDGVPEGLPDVDGRQLVRPGFLSRDGDLEGHAGRVPQDPATGEPRPQRRPPKFSDVPRYFK
ncbi:hypothetical protein [Methylobacterium sp. SD21]|uniref:hypothetical protein n=1 Tax=Methylobacterium litchii TaxID=3138810 RepID=UPI00313F3C5D